ncbi:hypothetical protein GCM10007094_33230 [Pseudovibrio japonicus]|uniref:Uncharacterized protein n=1 Tax=Pseudovibrio japonicus TaxID=366534 RepID=A0ABQ3EIL5_9HYPH|nr:hypothetical protein GCM10007094_33230 [Pseudovibrio japonicus]
MIAAISELDSFEYVWKGKIPVAKNNAKLVPKAGDLPTLEKIKTKTSVLSAGFTIAQRYPSCVSPNAVLVSRRTSAPMTRACVVITLSILINLLKVVTNRIGDYSPKCPDTKESKKQYE